MEVSLGCSFHGEMGLRVLPLCFLLFLGVSASEEREFTFTGFRNANLTRDGSAAVTSGGLLTLTEASRQVGHAFFPHPLRFKAFPNGSAFSFSSNFVFAVIPEFPEISGHGLALVISPSPHLNSSAAPPTFLGLLNPSNNGDARNHLVAVELDMIQNSDADDIDDNHVGIDVNSMRSINSSTAGYYVSDAAGDPYGATRFVNLSLPSGEPMQIWVEYSGGKKQLNVTLSPMNVPKPGVPLLSSTVDLSNVTMETMYVGFSAASGKFTTSHVILGWSFNVEGNVQPFELSSLPSLPRRGSPGKTSTLAISLSLGVPAAVLAVVAGVMYAAWRQRKFSEILEDWEQDYGPHRFSYRDLFGATKGFREKELLGAGGFGKVYRGVLPASKAEVAVKKISHDSRQGMREFVAEIVSIGRLRHRSLVQLLGYCRRKGELLLVYDFMPNGSLDRFLFDRASPVLDWNLRYRIIKDVASGLLYLHEEWEQVVLHRDVKASNVLLDGDFGGRLGDFGLARLYDHKAGPQTTHVVGTVGYIAPELTRTSRATTATDVFAFGAFLLEVASGRRPIEKAPEADVIVLVDWVLENRRKGEILRSVDPRLGDEYAVRQAELVLMLGLYCSHPSPAARPGMRLVMQILDGDAPLPEEISSDSLIASFRQWQELEAFDDFVSPYPPSIATASGTPSLLSAGR